MWLSARHTACVQEVGMGIPATQSLAVDAPSILLESLPSPLVPVSPPGLISLSL